MFSSGRKSASPTSGASVSAHHSGDQNYSSSPVASLATSPCDPQSPPMAAVSAFIPSSSAFDAFDAQSSHQPRRSRTSPFGDENAPFASSPATMTCLRIRRLPLNTSEESLRLMLVWSQDLIDVELLPLEHLEEGRFRSALLYFRSHKGAYEAQSMLDGRTNISNDASMVAEIVDSTSSSPSSQAPATTASGSGSGSGPGPGSGSAGAASMVAGSSGLGRPSSRFNAHFQSLGRISPTSSTSHDLPNPESSFHYQNLFSPQSPIGNHVTEATSTTGKTLIANSFDDDETSDLLKDPVAYAENGSSSQRRATAPQIPINGMSRLSLNTASVVGPPSLPLFPSSRSAHPSTMSSLNGPAANINFPMSSGPQYGRQNFPPVNPADQNPPCNTLYVGNLPIDTSEEELKALFSKQRGYKRLCFRTKTNGPMCFVEFEDISFATKTLHELYGYQLSNSTKGGIRLSFSKNPLGVRSNPPQAQGQVQVQVLGQPSVGSSNGHHRIPAPPPGFSNGYGSANGPPPGLAAPPGLGNVQASSAHFSLSAQEHYLHGNFRVSSDQSAPNLRHNQHGRGHENPRHVRWLPPHMIGH